MLATETPTSVIDCGDNLAKPQTLPEKCVGRYTSTMMSLDIYIKLYKLGER
jgi:hypothetical protein